MWLSMVRSSTWMSSSYAASISALRLLTTPGRLASACRIRNSVTVSVTGSFFHVQVWRSGSMRSRPRSSTLAASVSFGALPSLGAAQDRLDALDQKPLRERFADEIVGAHLEPEQLVDLLVLGGEEDHRHVRLLAQSPQSLHAVHARHLDVENGEVGRGCLETVERRSAVGICHDPITFGLECDRDRGQDVAVVVDESDGRHEAPVWHSPPALKPGKQGRNVANP